MRSYLFRTTATISDKNHRKDEHGYYARELAKYQIGNDIEEAIKDIEKARYIAAKHQYREFEAKAIALLA